MILESTAIKSNLQELAEMPDNMMKVIAIVATPQGTEVGELKAKVASLRRQLSDLQGTGRRRSNSRSNWRT